ncbi:MAG: prepilin peptidase [Patescibacteria group bacterium]|nr:prepilin peptidase [Patescibacteria group bacterium]
MAFPYLIFFLLGLIIGSFLNSVIYRLKTGQSFLFKRSHCPHCQHILSWSDLIPVLSFLIQKGKCRYCQKNISWQYPLVELATGILFVFAAFLIFPKNSQLDNIAMAFLTSFYYLTIICFLIVIFVYDLKYFIIPDKIIYPAIGVAFLYQLLGIWNFGHWNLFRIWDLGFGILPSVFFLAIILFSQARWMGFGDFKLAILIGLFLGFPKILVAFFLAFFLGALIGTILVISGKKTLKSEIPFGPFLVAGTLIALFWGQKTIDWYWQLF